LYYFYFINAEEAKDDDLSSLLITGVYFRLGRDIFHSIKHSVNSERKGKMLFLIWVSSHLLCIQLNKQLCFYNWLSRVSG